MKKLLLLTTLSVCCFLQSASAQTDAKAKSILQAVSKKMNGLHSMKANFSLQLIGANGKTNQTKKGTFYMKGEKYRISLGDQEIICDNKTVWTYIKPANEVQVSNYNPEGQTISPAKLFTDFYDKEYRYKYLGTQTFEGKSASMIELLPTGKDRQFSKVELAVDKNNTILGGNVYEKNGNHYRYSISNFLPNTNISDATFTFNKREYPNVEVVDLR